MTDEEMAEEYRKDLKSKFFLSEPQLDLACQGFKDGYNKAKEEMQEQGLALQSDMDKTIEQNIALKKELNKANEWHYVKDGDLPPENVPLNIITFDKDKKRRLWEGEYKGGNGQWWTGYFNHFIDVPYAWKEIELPKEE